MTAEVTTAVFPVAGRGTRFLPATKSLPKELLILVDRPLIAHAVDEARAAGIRRFVFVTGPGKGLLEDALEGLFDDTATAPAPELVAMVRQPAPLGLGHAVWCARGLTGEAPFAVLLPDNVLGPAPGGLAPDPLLGRMIAARGQAPGSVVALRRVPPARTGAYGIAALAPGTDPESESTLRIAGLVEKPAPGQAPSDLAVIGRYVLDPAVLHRLEGAAPGAGGEIQLTDALAAEAAAGRVRGLRHAGPRFDCGAKAGYLQATVAFALARPDLRGAFRDWLDGLDIDPVPPERPVS